MNVKDNIIAIDKTCTLTSRSRLKSYKRLVSVSSFYVSCPSLITTTTTAAAAAAGGITWYLVNDPGALFSLFFQLDVDVFRDAAEYSGEFSQFFHVISQVVLTIIIRQSVSTTTTTMV